MTVLHMGHLSKPLVKSSARHSRWNRCLQLSMRGTTNFQAYRALECFRHHFFLVDQPHARCSWHDEKPVVARDLDEAESGAEEVGPRPLRPRGCRQRRHQKPTTPRKSG